MSKICIYGIIVQLSLFTFVFATSGEAQTKSVNEITISINIKSPQKLDGLIEQIEESSDFSFSHIKQELNTSSYTVMLESREYLLGDLLRSISSQTDLSFHRVNEYIQIRKKQVGVDAVVEEIQVNQTITGTITDENGEPLPGATIVEKGTTNGTITDVDGKFSLSVSGNSILQISFVGYSVEEVVINGQTHLEISLMPDLQSLEEVVVVGYGTQEKSDVTGSVSSVSGKTIRDMPVTNFEQAMKGQVAGVQIFQNSGSPNSSLTVRIRGNTSLSSANGPLYVVDGYPLSGGSGTGDIPGGANPLSNINPNDIESIDILKDASATAIYGSRGANGVVIITTKSGKTGKAKFDLSLSTGWQSPTKKLNVLNAEEFAEYHIESRNNGWLRSGGDPNVPNENRGRFRVADIYFTPELWDATNWQDEIFRTGMMRNYNLTASGGSSDIKYSISGGYFENEGIILGTSLKRYSFRSNIDAKLNDRVSVGFRLNPSYSKGAQQNTDGHFTSTVLGMALRQVPIIGPYDEDGTYTNPLSMRNNTTGIGSIGPIDNPVANAVENKYEINQARLLGNTFIDFEIVDGLKFRTSLGVDYVATRTHLFLSSLTRRPTSASPPPNIPEGSAYSTEKVNWLNENLLTYETSFSDQHRLTVMAGYSAQFNDNRVIFVEGTQYPSDNAPYVNSAGLISDGTEGHNQWSLISYFGRLNYSFRGKYLLTTTIRRDGSSRFGGANKYGVFPSAAFAWRVSEENFMESLKPISDLKLRLSYGVAGNNNIGNYAHVATISSIGYTAGQNQQFVNAIASNNFANSGISWETTKSFNIGINLGLIKNRIELTTDIYKSNTDGLLLALNIPSVSGFNSTIANIGQVENEGLEFALETTNIASPITWNTSFNISFNRNKVISLGNSEDDFILDGISRTVVGRPMGQFYARVTDGVFNTQEEIEAHVPQDNNPEPGDRRFVDVNNDGRVDGDDLDFVGNPFPDFTFGITNSFTFKGFDLNIVMNGSYGNDVYYNYVVGANMNGNLNQDGVVRGRWRSAEEPGTGNVPKAIFGYNTLADRDSDFFVFDGSYLRLTNVTLGYSLPEKVASKAMLSNARVYISGQNLLTFTNYPGFDPEIAASGSTPTSFGIDQGIYPVSKVFTIGLNASF